MRVQSFEATVQKPVFERKVIGRIPADQYVQDKPFVPSRVDPPATDWIDVEADVPLRDPQLNFTEEPITLQEAPYSPLLRGAACAVIGGALAASLGHTTGGITGALVAGLAGAGLGGAIGAATASGDQLALKYKPQTVFEPVFKGYTHHTLDGAYVPEKPVHWWQDGGGTLHYYMADIQEKAIGTVQVPEVRHSALAPEGAVVLSAVMGIAAGAAAPLLAAAI